MAGFLDAEGSLAVNRQFRRDRPSPTYRIRIGVSNAVSSILEPFSREYGGKIYHHKEFRTRANGLKWSDSFQWRCPSLAYRRFLIDMLPYLKLKGAQAMALLKVLDEFKDRSHRRKKDGRFIKSTKAQVRRLEHYYRLVQTLNRRVVPR